MKENGKFALFSKNARRARGAMHKTGKNNGNGKQASAKRMTGLQFDSMIRRISE